MADNTMADSRPDVAAIFQILEAGIPEKPMDDPADILVDRGDLARLYGEYKRKRAEIEANRAQAAREDAIE
jgi:hypothetical protein